MEFLILRLNRKLDTNQSALEIVRYIECWKAKKEGKKALVNFIQLIKKELNSQQMIIKREQQEYINNYKGHEGCYVCCERCYQVLNFHHKVSAEKNGSIFKMINRGCSWAELLNEIAKCVVLCNNCHQKVHNRIMYLLYSVN